LADPQDIKLEETPPEFPSDDAQDPIAFLEESLAQANAQRDEYLALAQRVQADFENYRRRNVAAATEAYDSGRLSIIEQVLPVLDNIERAVEAAQDEATREGVSLVRRQLSDLFERWGLTPIDRGGEPFDPAMENAVLQGGPEEGAPGTVSAVLQKGYRFGSRVLRHALVRVVGE
jgi:molecular chaperone GrpE